MYNVAYTNNPLKSGRVFFITSSKRGTQDAYVIFPAEFGTEDYYEQQEWAKLVIEQSNMGITRLDFIPMQVPGVYA